MTVLVTSPARYQCLHGTILWWRAREPCILRFFHWMQGPGWWYCLQASSPCHTTYLEVFLGVLSPQGQCEHSHPLWRLQRVEAFFLVWSLHLDNEAGTSRSFSPHRVELCRPHNYWWIQPSFQHKPFISFTSGCGAYLPPRLSQSFCPHIFKPCTLHLNMSARGHITKRGSGPGMHST